VVRRFGTVAISICIIASLSGCGAIDGIIGKPTEVVQENDDLPKVSINGKTVKFESELIEKDGEVLASVREICDAVGAEFYYEDGYDDLHIISIIKGTRMVTVINGHYGAQDFMAEKWRINSYAVKQSDVEFAELYSWDESDKTLMKTEPVILDGKIYIPVREVLEYLGAQSAWNSEKKTVELQVYDTAFSRNIDDINRDKKFTYSIAEEIFCNLPDVKGTDAEEMSGIYSCGFGFNQKGKVYGYCNVYDELIYIYSDGTVTYADSYGEKINEIHVEVPQM